MKRRHPHNFKNNNSSNNHSNNHSFANKFSSKKPPNFTPLKINKPTYSHSVAQPNSVFKSNNSSSAITVNSKNVQISKSRAFFQNFSIFVIFCMLQPVQMSYGSPAAVYAVSPQTTNHQSGLAHTTIFATGSSNNSSTVPSPRPTLGSQFTQMAMNQGGFVPLNSIPSSSQSVSHQHGEGTGWFS